MTRAQVSNNKRVLQEQVIRFTNEIEELQLEREASKKNVLHFMQEADITRQELKKAQELIEELTHNQHTKGYNSPPPESNEVEHNKQQTPSVLFSKLSLLSQDKLANLFDLVENNKLDMIGQLSTELHQMRLRNEALEEELDQLQEEYQATRGALQVENEKAGIFEHRWEESESNLEQAESTIQALSSELANMREQQEWQSTNQSNSLSKEELGRMEEQLQNAAKDYEHCKLKLDATKRSSEHWQEKYDELSVEYSRLYKKQKEDVEQTKIRENYLKTINKTLRDEMRKIKKAQDDIINIEYLRNVIIKFLERKNTQAQLVPILSTLLKCPTEDQSRLYRLTRNQMAS